MKRLQLDESLASDGTIHHRAQRQNERHDSLLLLIQHHFIEKDVALADVRLHVSLHHPLLVHVCNVLVKGSCGGLRLSAEMVANGNQRVISLNVGEYRLLEGLRPTKRISIVALAGPVLFGDAVSQRGIAGEEGENHETGGSQRERVFI